MSEKFLTLHPEGKQGTNIDKKKYEMVKDAILEVITHNQPIAFQELLQKVGRRLPHFDGSINWYTISVKLDLEARGLIERIPQQTPQQLRLKQ